MPPRIATPGRRYRSGHPPLTVAETGATTLSLTPSASHDHTGSLNNNSRSRPTVPLGILSCVSAQHNDLTVDNQTSGASLQTPPQTYKKSLLPPDSSPASTTASIYEALYSFNSTPSKPSSLPKNLSNVPGNTVSHRSLPSSMSRTAEFSVLRVRGGARPDWKSFAPRMKNIRERVAAAKGLVSLHKDERELLDPRRGLGPSCPTTTEPADTLDINAAQALMAISHQNSNNVSLDDTAASCQYCYQEDSSDSAAQKVTAVRRDIIGREDSVHPMSVKRSGYLHSGDTTDDESQLSGNSVSENEAHTGSTSDEEEVSEKAIVLEMRPRIKLVLHARPSTSPNKVTKRKPKGPPRVREKKVLPKEGREMKSTITRPVPPQPARRSTRTQKKRVPFPGVL
ncbi:MAG: hypothetical protein M1839_001359 [Geoglossum umbratile]|nr:MAG: hypothetical protein M1839_001359 [Geoglossum umbratile]